MAYIRLIKTFSVKGLEIHAVLPQRPVLVPNVGKGNAQLFVTMTPIESTAVPPVLQVGPSL